MQELFRRALLSGEDSLQKGKKVDRALQVPEEKLPEGKGLGAAKENWPYRLAINCQIQDEKTVSLPLLNLKRFVLIQTR